MPRTAQDVIKQMDAEGVRFVRLLFTDILGRLKGMSITRSEIEAVLEDGQGFDGSSIEGFVRIEESDLMAWPDLASFRVLPWKIADEKVACVFCDIKNPDGTPYEGDPRAVLRRNLEAASKHGFKAYFGPEIEYFLFKNDGNTSVLDHDGYFDYDTVDAGAVVRKRCVVALENMGIPVECGHHEVAPSQHEIDLKYQEAMVMADFVQLQRLTIKEIALQNDLYATFMPKPLFGENGSGMHVHQSLFRGDKNAFFDKGDEYNLSKVARQYVAGLLENCSAFTLVTNQWVNSYKRMVPGYEAPAYVSWGRRNRSSLVRIPMYRVGKENATRVELRSPDPACNPYLAFSAMLASGLSGIEKDLNLADPIEDNIFHMDDKAKKRRKIRELPNSLENAIHAFEKSAVMRSALGDHIFESLMANKWMEWDRYRTHVSQFELDNYLPVL
jgi:glutamine synthetase